MNNRKSGYTYTAELVTSLEKLGKYVTEQSIIDTVYNLFPNLKPEVQNDIINYICNEWLNDRLNDPKIANTQLIIYVEKFLLGESY